ncbi:ABC transporter permease [Lysinibacillus piscis]|uniref:ABC transporter permease n=1 Tax=Lysinibacillus piscis TaxID=2518931 RepID=A0ABQ5NMK2_9BACI|nr:ABC transporter permease [Lysinibacillus sp. KH24]GLC89591.1 ABC transporter permease [Lysinibacillus sp. KH24]
MTTIKVEAANTKTTVIEKKKKVNRFLKSGVLGWVVILVVWQIASLFSEEMFLPSPYATFKGMIEIASDGTLFVYMGYSFARVLAGWSLGLLIAVPVGLLIGTNTWIRTILEPVINFVRFIPPLAFITLFMLWFGIGEQSKVFLIVYATFFVITINTLTGVLSISKDKLLSARSMGATKFQTLLHVVIPAAVPYIFTGAKLAMGSSFMAIIGAEMVAANEGIGFMIWNARLYFKTDWIFVGLVVLGLMGFLMDRLFTYGGRKFLARYKVVS